MSSVRLIQGHSQGASSILCVAFLGLWDQVDHILAQGLHSMGDHPSSFTYCGSSLECSSLHPIYCSFNKQGFHFLFSHNKQSAGTWFWHDFSCSAKPSQTPALSAHLLSFIFPGPVEAHSSHLRACHFPVARWLLSLIYRER